MIPLSPRPGETVYSYVTRYHFKVGIGHEKNTYKAIFNKSKIRIHPYLPNHLNALNVASELTALEWAIGHTLYPLFKLFGHDKKGLLLNAMLNTGKVLSLAHIPHSRLTFEFGHKYCPICYQTSRADKGFPYYDIRHQVPGINTCYQHGCMLNIMTGGDCGLDRHLSLPKQRSTPASSSAIQFEFARFCDQVLTLSRDIKYGYSHLSNIYKYHLKKNGLITRNEQIRMHRTISLITGHYESFEFTSGLERLSNFTFLGPLLREKTHFPCHPIKHLLFAFWLFDKDASQFRRDHLSLTKESLSPQRKRVKCDKKIMALLNQGHSMSKIRQVTGKSLCYIRRVCDLNGIERRSNTNSFPNKIKHGVLIQAQLGRHRIEIAKSLGVGVGYVEQIISNTMNLTKWRKDLAIQKKLSSAYQEIKTAKREHPDWIRKDFKSQHNKAFFTLYRYAKNVLESLLPKKTKPSVPSRDWAQEDNRLYNAINELDTPSNLSINKISHLINDHGHLRKKLDKLPRTRALLLKLGKIS